MNITTYFEVCGREEKCEVMHPCAYLMLFTPGASAVVLSTIWVLFNLACASTVVEWYCLVDKFHLVEWKFIWSTKLTLYVIFPLGYLAFLWCLTSRTSLFCRYCLADDRLLEAVKFLDLGDGAGWELLQVYKCHFCWLIFFAVCYLFSF